MKNLLFIPGSPAASFYKIDALEIPFSTSPAGDWYIELKNQATNAVIERVQFASPTDLGNPAACLIEGIQQTVRFTLTFGRVFGAAVTYDSGATTYANPGYSTAINYELDFYTV